MIHGVGLSNEKLTIELDPRFWNFHNGQLVRTSYRPRPTANLLWGRGCAAGKGRGTMENHGGPLHRDCRNAMQLQKSSTINQRDHVDYMH